MESAAEGMREALSETALSNPTIPVWSNVTANQHLNGEIADRLVDQITGSVRWAEQCMNMAKMYDGHWHELGPGSVLRGLMRRIDREVKVQIHDEP